MKHNVTLTESELKQFISDKINEAIEDEGLWGNIKNAFGKGVSDAYSNGGGMKDAWKAGKQQFNKLQNTDKNINQYQKAKARYDAMCKQRDNLKNQWEQACNEVQKMANYLSQVSKQQGKGNYQYSKQAASQGMDANQMDRASRQQASA